MIDREDALRKAREATAKRLEEKDIAITNAVALIDDINETTNILGERLTIWYYKGLKRHADQKVIEEILASTDETTEIAQLKTLAGEIHALHSLKEVFTNYIALTVKELLPNASELVGEGIAAQLLAKAGTMQKLTKMPASTIQVLGAEKALFKHLRTGARSPKHGVIFNHPAINRAPRRIRGKIARAIASKLSIAIKVDACSKKPVAAMLKEQMEKRISAINEHYDKIKDTPDEQQKAKAAEDREKSRQEAQQRFSKPGGKPNRPQGQEKFRPRFGKGRK